MNAQKLLICFGLAALAMGFSPAACAQSTSSSSLTSFSYQLVDLDLTDGIAAGLTMSPVITFVAASGFSNADGNPDVADTHNGVGTASIAKAYGNASATYDATGVYGSRNAIEKNYSVLSNALVSWNFVLSANTSVVFSGTGSASVQGYGSSAAVSLFSYGFPDGDLRDEFMVFEGSESRLLSLSFASSQGGLSGTIGSTIQGSAEWAAAPVPEPETYAMLLAGLGLIGACVSRRRKTSAV